jgi:hypothetical protein
MLKNIIRHTIQWAYNTITKAFTTTLLCRQTSLGKWLYISYSYYLGELGHQVAGYNSLSVLILR